MEWLWKTCLAVEVQGERMLSPSRRCNTKRTRLSSSDKRIVTMAHWEMALAILSRRFPQIDQRYMERGDRVANGASKPCRSSHQNDGAAWFGNRDSRFATLAISHGTF